MNLTMSEQQSLQKTVSNTITELEYQVSAAKASARVFYVLSDKDDPETKEDFERLNNARTEIRRNKALIAKLAKLSKILKGQ